jgi:hypothetical protein
MRKKLSVASFQKGKGSVGALRRSKLRPKPSLTNFDILKSEQDCQDREKDNEEGEAEPKML